VNAHIEADGSLCMGSGNCVELAPRHFTQDEATGLVEVIDADVSEADLPDVERAAQICPAGVIRIEHAS
jgi:ferredoxin